MGKVVEMRFMKRVGVTKNSKQNSVFVFMLLVLLYFLYLFLLLIKLLLMKHGDPYQPFLLSNKQEHKSWRGESKEEGGKGRLGRG